MPRLPRTPSSHKHSGESRNPIFVLLEDCVSGEHKYFCNPEKIICCTDPARIGEALHDVDAALANGFYVAGFMAYELGYVLEEKLKPLMPQTLNTPLIWLGVYRNLEKEKVDVSGEAEIKCLSPTWNKATYKTAFDRVKKYIGEGDVYQIDLTFKMLFDVVGEAAALYARLKRQQQARYAAHIHFNETDILSLSPELFFKIKDGSIYGRPMKGTAPRGAIVNEDNINIKNLSNDAKQRAENLMIVDLMRNDFGRIAELGSVEVTDLYSIETLSSLHQMTSGIKARLKKGVGASAIIRALFPCGSVVGAPKIRAQQIIQELEELPRGIYTGAIGYFAPNGEAQFNVAIRTLALNAGKGEMGIGSGVVFDSNVSDEYAECLLKAKFLQHAGYRVSPEWAYEGFELFETLLWKPGSGFYLIERHVARLKNAARHFDFQYKESAVLKALNESIADMQTVQRVKLVLKSDGGVAISCADLGINKKIWNVKIAEQKLNPEDEFLKYKTTKRDLYDAELAKAKAEGFDEVLFLNNKDELCEGAITNIFLEKGGKLYTPACSSGLLPGTLRAELLETGKAQEKVLYMDDLRSAEKIYVGNSVRGLIEAQIDINPL